MNKVIATVQNIEETDIVTHIQVNCGESVMYLIKSQRPQWLSVGDIISLSTATAYEKLELQEGCPATMLLRGIDIKLEPIFKQEISF